MFGTLLGALPRPPGDDDAVVEIAVRAQADAGLEPITDGRLGSRARPVDAWRFTASLTTRAVKQSMPGPYSAGWAGATSSAAARRRLVMDAAEALRLEVEELASAGCPLVEIEELEAHRIGTDEAERRLFREAHRVATEGVTETHLSLSLVGPAADAAGIETILAAPYASLAVDLIAGPDNWDLVARVPGDRGVIVGALSAARVAEPKEVLLWGAHYAASTGGRGRDRVGLGSAGSWATRTWEQAVERMHALGEASRLAAMPPGEELRRSLDPRAVSARRAALGHDAPPPPNRAQGAPPKRGPR